MILSDMISDARRHLDASEKFLSGSEVEDRLFASQQEILRSIVKEDPSFFVAYKDIPLSSGTATYDLPLNARMGTRLIFVQNTNSSRGLELPAANWQQYLTLESPGIINLTDSWSFIMEGSKVRVTPTPQSSSTIRVWYSPSYGNMIEGPAAAATSTTIQLYSGNPDYINRFGKIDARNDYYNGMEIRILSGNGEGQSRVISDYVGSTRTATVDTWDTTPDASSKFCIMCPVPEDHHALVPLRAALLMSAKNRNRGPELNNLYYGNPQQRGMFYELMHWVSNRAQSENEIVAPLDYGY